MLAAAALACGGQDGMTDGTGGAGSSSSSGSTGAEGSTGGTTAAPTTTGDGTTTTGDATTGPMCETSADSCGVMVSEVDSKCEEPPPATSELKVEVLGPGSIRVTEIGHDASCTVTITPVVKIFSPNTISVTYDIGGQPNDGCICKFAISARLDGLPSGTWTVDVLPHSQKVDVP